MGADPVGGRSTARREIVSLTSLRGGLALWVALYHFWNDVLALFPTAQIISPIILVGKMAVPAFFMLSGYVLSYNYGERFATITAGETLRFLGLRLARVYPVHLVTLLVVAAMVWASGRLGYQLTDSGYTTRDFILNLLLAQTWVPDFELNWNYPSWSISSEWFAYILFPFACAGVLRRLTTPFRATAFGAAAVAASIFVVSWWRPWPFYELILVVPTFFAGAALHWILRDRAGRPVAFPWRWLPEALAVALAAACFVPSDQIMTALLLCGLFFIIAALARLETLCSPIWSAVPFVFLGEVSYSLYMTHTLAQKLTNRLLPSARFEASSLGIKLLVLAAYAALILLACLISYFLVEAPSRRTFKRMMARPPAPTPSP